MADELEHIRCPKCLGDMAVVIGNGPVRDPLRCLACHQPFRWQDRMPGSAPDDPHSVALAEAAGRSLPTPIVLAAWGGLTVVACVVVWMTDPTIEGPVFLGIYIGFIIATMLMQWAIRAVGDDLEYVSMLAFLLVVAIGGVRLLAGWDPDMPFTVLLAVMVFGGMAQFLRGHHFDNANSGAAGCGGCGGCGGGCGGCGGCGG